MKKRILSIILSLCMVVTLVPQVAYAASTADSTPSLSAYASKAQMTDSTFAPRRDGNAVNTGKLVFGKSSSGSAQEWYILGSDSGVSGDNTMLFAASPLVPGYKFDGQVSDIVRNAKAEKALEGNCQYPGTAVPSIVYRNHYGASALHSQLESVSTKNFTAAEESMMNATKVMTKDTRNNLQYTTTDTLYAPAAEEFGSDRKKIMVGSNNQITLTADSYWNDEEKGFWLRTPGSGINDKVLHDSLLSLIVSPDKYVYYYVVPAEYNVRPAANLNMSKVLFASAAAAERSSTDAKYGTIEGGKAMTLRLDGSGKNIGTATFSTVSDDIIAKKGSTSYPVSLVVQGRDGSKDWYYSRKLSGTDEITVKTSAIKSALSLSDIDLSSCKIWLEAYSDTKDRGDGLVYAVEGEERAEPVNSAYVTKKQLMYSFRPSSDGTAVNVGKLVFGNKQNADGKTYSPQEWYILGKDKGISGDNTVIFAANTMKYDQKFSLSKSNGTYNGTEVYANHYGASALRKTLNSMAESLDYFSTGEQSVMNATPVKTKDAKNGGSYTTTDKLYALTADKCFIETIKAGSANDKALLRDTYWAGRRPFWLRAPVDDTSFENHNERALDAFSVVEPEYINIFDSIMPAGNLDLSSVLFASAAEASSVDTAAYGRISSGKAMTLRFDGKNKNLGRVAYDLPAGEIRAVKGSASGTVSLVVQGNDGTEDWYYSRKVTGTQTVKASEIKSALELSGDIDLSSCHIWIEKKESDGLIYAVSAYGCSTEAELLNAIENGVTSLCLSSDITLNSTLNLSDKVLTLDLNGHTLKGDIMIADSSAAPDSILTLVDSNAAKGGKVDGKITLTKSGGNVSHLYANGGTVTGMVSLPSYAGKIYCTSSTPTAFKGYVGNYGEIHGGIFYGDVNESCIKEKTVTFKDGESRYALEVVPSENKAAAPAQPSKTGYTFVGWYDGDNKFDFSSEVTGDITLEATWVVEDAETEAEFEEAVALGSTFIRLKKDIELTNKLDLSDKVLTLDLNGRTLKGNVLIADTSAAPLSKLILEDSSDSNKGVLKGDIELTRGSYGTGSHLYANGGTVTGKVSLNSYVAEIHCTGSTPTVFKGYVGNYGSIYGGIYLSGINESCIKAKTVTFMDGNSKFAYEVAGDGKVCELNVTPPVKTGYGSFEGWYNGDTKYVFGSAISENLTLTAKYGNPVNYSITYNLDGGSADNPGTYTVESDDITLEIPTKENYVFTGWSGTDLTGDNNMTVTIPKGSTGGREYTANYTRVAGFTVIFDSNGGDYIAPKTNLTVVSKVLEGVTAPTRAGYTFKGWKCGDKDVDENTTYGDLATTTTTTTATTAEPAAEPAAEPETTSATASEIQLTAQWEAKNYKVSFNDDNGVADDNIPDKTGVKWDDKVLDDVTSPEKEGYSFEGWKCGDADVTADTTYGELVSDDTVGEITLTAQWAQLPAPTGYIAHDENNEGKVIHHWKNYRGRVSYFEYFNTKQTVTIIADGGNSVSKEYLLSDRVLTIDELDKADFNKYTRDVELSNNQKYIVYARLTNTYGYVTYISSEAIIIDTAAPVISGIVSGKTYCESQKVTVTDVNLNKVTVNGDIVTLDENKQLELAAPEADSIEYVIAATDNAKNQSEITVTVRGAHEDKDNNHRCDYCGEKTSEHEDRNSDHMCDICGEKTSGHKDENTDSICDICGETVNSDPVVENGENNTIVDMSGSTGIADGTATSILDEETAKDIIETADNNSSSEIVLDTTSKGETADSVNTSQMEIPRSALKAIAKDTGADLTIKTDVGTVTIDNSAAGAVADQAEGDNVRITLEKAKADTEGSNVKYVLKIVSQGVEITDLKEGKATVTVTISDELKDSEPVCVNIDSNGIYHKIGGSLQEDGTYTFTTGVLSTFAIMPVAEADAVIATYIKDIKTAKVSGIVSRTYTGKTITQNPAVSLDGEKLVKGTDYDLKYSKNKSVGTATVKIEGKGKYKGYVTRTFRINPKGTSISKTYRAKRAFTVKWKRQFTKMSSSRITGYQIRYSRSSKMTGAKIKTVKGYGKKYKKVRRLKARKYYYVQVRTYKKVSGKNYYSGWSKVKRVKTR